MSEHRPLSVFGAVGFPKRANCPAGGSLDGRSLPPSLQVNSSDERTQPRREFLGQVAVSAIVLAGAACSTPAATGQSPTQPTPTQTPSSKPGPQPAEPPPLATGPVHWDDSWFTRLTAKHKAVFDSPQIEDGLVLANATGYIRGMRDALSAGDNDVQTVIVVRHAAIVMAFNDAMWEKYEIGKDKKIKDGRTDNWATHNPYLNGGSRGGGGRGGSPPSNDNPVSTFAWLASHGQILLACDLATRNYSNVIARNFNVDQRAVYEELKANLVPGMILQPTGVYAALRAQEAGCNYIRST